MPTETIVPTNVTTKEHMISQPQPGDTQKGGKDDKDDKDESPDDRDER